MTEQKIKFTVEDFDSMVLNLMKNDQIFLGMMKSYIVDGKSVSEIEHDLLTEEDKKFIKENESKNMSIEKLDEEMDMINLREMTRQAVDYIVDKNLAETDIPGIKTSNDI